MRLSQFYRQIGVIKEDLDLWSLNVAEPALVDGESYATVAALQKVEVDPEAGEVRFIPRHSGDDGFPAASLLGAALESLPGEAGGANDLRLMTQLPLVEKPREHPQRRLVEIQALHLGLESQEAWLLVRPLEEYPADALPT
jgi:hypothetical protein